MHQRTQIRYYIVDMLKSAVDVGGRVFANRPDPCFLSEAPCVFVYFGNESIDIESGDRYCAHEYERTLSVKIDILSLESEDHLDYLGEQVENALGHDWFLGRNLDGFSETNRIGLSRGMTLASVEPYEVNTSSENTAYGQTITVNVPYIYDNYSHEKPSTWKEYYFEIRRTDGVTTDPVLSAGEGEL
jgi:hypothetical protein